MRGKVKESRRTEFERKGVAGVDEGAEEVRGVERSEDEVKNGEEGIKRDADEDP